MAHGIFRNEALHKLRLRPCYRGPFHIISCDSLRGFSEISGLSSIAIVYTRRSIIPVNSLRMEL